MFRSPLLRRRLSQHEMKLGDNVVMVTQGFSAFVSGSPIIGAGMLVVGAVSAGANAMRVSDEQKLEHSEGGPDGTPPYPDR